MTYSSYGILRLVAWEVEGTDEFAEWFTGLSEEEQVAVGRVVDLLVEHGPALPFPYSSRIETSRHHHMRELRIQHEGRPYRVPTPSIHGGRRFSCSAGIRVATGIGTTRTFRKRTRFTTSTSANWNWKD